ncbi:MAG TPA: galactokinase [Bryobacteraceae bacterium]|nr:galactokinase [Bryobacteraceae bacterium]
MVEEFRQRFGSAEGIRAFRAPGRVNLIGEHTDYNLGFVLPMALELATFVAVAPNADGKLRIYSEARNETREWDAAAIGECSGDRTWADYPIGVGRELLRRGFSIDPANLLIRSTVPEGAGLSSSAALEVACALAFLKGRPLPPLELARLCQQSEIRFVGIPCGIMDQYVSVFATKGSALELDCRSLEHRYVPLPESVTFVAVNTMVKHALAASAYRERVAECAAAVAGIQQLSPRVESLRDVSRQAFDAAAGTLPPLLVRRARHVVSENGRVGAFRKACKQQDTARMGSLLVDSHRSLQYDYEVSCPELDFLVEAACRIKGVYGARMTGGGFGGSIIAMVESSALDGFHSEISEAYQGRFSMVPGIYHAMPFDGANELTNLRQFPPAAN